ncbi:MAG: glycerol-3-phosphate acyltransferase [Patescibacteria group bacterium]
MFILYLILIFIVCYFIGSFPTAYFITRKFTGKDIRTYGTGNVGAMNVSRATGKFYLFLLTFLGDVLKGALPVFVVKRVAESLIVPPSEIIWFVTAAAAGVVWGHCFSIYFKIKEGKFSGGKAIASLIGILSILNFNWLFLPWGLVCIFTILASGNLFLGQFMGTVFLPIIGWFLVPEYFWFCVLLAIPVFIKQWPRFIPLLEGKEPSWYFKSKKSKS